MATVKLNGQTSPSNMLCFSDAINIVEYDSSITGTNATLTIEFSDDLQASVTADSQYYITILDETITNVMNPLNATNRRFYIGGGNATAAYAARALAECDSLAVDFYITNYDNMVTLTARQIGSKFLVPQPYSTNIESGVDIQYIDGSASSAMWGGKVSLDVGYNSNIVARLEKNVYTNNIAWNISPVISSLAEYGKAVPFTMLVEELSSDGSYNLGSSSLANYVTYGYLANQSESYLPAHSDMILINNTRGSNNIILYTYGNTIPFTVLATTSPANGSWAVYNSANTLPASGNTPAVATNGYMADLKATIPDATMEKAYYIDIKYSTSTVRFNVIKPIKMSEGATRIYWRNEYGDISFFDFTGQRSESDSVDVTTYQKNFYDFYDHSSVFEQDKVYKSDVEKEVKVKSHLLENDGKYIANSLIRSKRMWTVVNGITHYVVPVAIEVKEEENYNNIYTITFTYKYSTLS